MIGVLPSSSVVEIHGEAQRKGKLAHSFLGTLKIEDEDVRCFIKAYQKENNLQDVNGQNHAVENKSLINEIIGYCLAKLVGMSLPERARFVVLNKIAIPSPPVWIDQDNWWSAVA